MIRLISDGTGPGTKLIYYEKDGEGEERVIHAKSLSFRVDWDGLGQLDVELIPDDVVIEGKRTPLITVNLHCPRCESWHDHECVIT